MKYQDRVSPHLSPPPLIPFHFLVSFTSPLPIPFLALSALIY